MKKILKIILLILIPFAFLISTNPSFATSNLNTGGSIGGQDKNNHLNNFLTGRFIETGDTTDKGVRNTIILIAKDVKNIFFMVATLYFLVISLTLILSSNTEESVGKFKKGIIWITVGIMTMQLAFSFTVTIFDKDISGHLASSITENLIDPIVLILETLTSAFFIAIAVYSFYRIATANGNDEKVKSGKMSILYAIIGYIVIRFARVMVSSMYGRINCESSYSSCLGNPNLGEATSMIVTIINWANSFIAIIVILVLIYAGFNIMLSGGDDEKIKKGKNSIIYIIIGLLILAMNYMILTFFL